MKTPIYPFEFNNPYSLWTGFLADLWNIPADSISENFSETPFEFTMKFNLPDIRKKHLKITVQGQNLTIEGSKLVSGKFFSKKSNNSIKTFRKEYTLHAPADTGKIKAKFRNRILTITIPKKEKYINFREIPVQSLSTGNDKVDVNEDKMLLNPIMSLKKLFRKAA